MLVLPSPLDTMTTKDLGRWESLGMVLRYTRRVKLEESLRLYQMVER